MRRCRTLRAWSIVLAGVMLAAGRGLADAPAAGPATLPAHRATQAAEGSFAGQWVTTYGVMVLTQDGKRVEGTYGGGGGAAGGGAGNRISGTVEDGKLTFTYQEPGVEGEGVFELAGDGSSFSGKWREKGQEAWHGWSGTRRGDGEAADGFAGLWVTTYGKMRLRQTGEKVEGTYLFGGRARIGGTVEGRTLKFNYEQPDGEKGEGTFELAAGGASFGGDWKGSKAEANGGGKWTGTRVRAQAGRVWLVILEAPWEHDLEEEEYSYGAMLRAFFTRTPRVKVRHRFIHSESDLRKWCEEIPYIAEPVVLYISSHGTAEGIGCGGKTIGAEALAECVRDSTNLMLLHFGACSVAGGAVPGKIHAVLGAANRFPISGFDRPVDWAGSAIVDFTYMDLVLARGMPPAEALEQTRRMVRFAGAKGEAGDAIPPTGLVLVAPPAAAPAAAPAGEKKGK